MNKFQPNAAGVRWQHLLREEWSTHASFFPQGDTESETVRAFYGNYTVTINYSGEQIDQQFFYLSKDGPNEIYLNVEGCA